MFDNDSGRWRRSRPLSTHLFNTMFAVVITHGSRQVPADRNPIASRHPGSLLEVRGKFSAEQMRDEAKMKH